MRRSASACSTTSATVERRGASSKSGAAMSAYDLTTVANVKTWLGLPLTPTASDPTLAGLAVAASRTIYAALSRTSLLPQAYTDTIDLESDRVYLANWPVQRVTSVVLDGLAVPPALPAGAPPTLGFLLQPERRRAAWDGRRPWTSSAVAITDAAKASSSPIRRAMRSRAKPRRRLRRRLICSPRRRRSAPGRATSASSTSAPASRCKRSVARRRRGNMRSTSASTNSTSPTPAPCSRCPTATCRRTWRKRRPSLPRNVSAPPNASGCAPNRSAARRRSPTISPGFRRRWRR